jgi:hypothetical protein
VRIHLKFSSLKRDTRGVRHQLITHHSAGQRNQLVRYLDQKSEIAELHHITRVQNAPAYSDVINTNAQKRVDINDYDPAIFLTQLSVHHRDTGIGQNDVRSAPSAYQHLVLIEAGRYPLDRAISADPLVNK